MLAGRILGAVVLAALAIEPASANRERGRAPANAPVPAAADVPVTIVSLGSQSIAVYAGTSLIAQGKISSGKPGHGTPTGVFSVLERKVYHESNLYSNAPMPWMQRLTWSGIALHAGQLPGYPASHGCIRMSDGFAAALFKRLGRGSRVLVTHGAVAPVAIAHPALPIPEPTPIAIADTAIADTRFTIASVGAVAAPSTWLTPKAAAEDARTKAKDLVDVTRLAARQQLVAAQTTIAALAATRDDRRIAEAEVIPYRRLVEQAKNDFARASDDDDRRQAEASLAAAEEAVADAEAIVADIAAEERALDAASFLAARSAREAEDAADEAETKLRLAQAGTAPLTVFISRKEGRAFARQGFEPVFEGDVTIRDAGEPLGTHVFTARAGDGTDLVWTVVTLGGGRGSPSSALDRVSLDPAFTEAMRRRAWAGTTLIISDQGLGPETGRGTDFVVLTR